MTARERMASTFECIHAETSVEDVLRRLKTPDADPLPVCDGDRLIGMVSYRDAAARAGGGGRWGVHPRARDLVAPDLIYCLETTKLEEAVALMRDNNVRSLPVLNASGRLVGMLALENVPADRAGPSDQGGAPG